MFSKVSVKVFLGYYWIKTFFRTFCVVPEYMKNVASKENKLYIEDWLMVSIQKAVHQVHEQIWTANIFCTTQVFRSPSRMAISRSYPRHLVQFCEKEKKRKEKEKSILPPCNVSRVSKGSQGLLRVTNGY